MLGSTKLDLAGGIVAVDHDGWSGELREEFRGNAFNYRVGGRLIFENDRVKVWEIRLAPGERLPAHRHVLDYFWTAVNAGSSRQHTDDGTTREVSYEEGETRFFRFGQGEYLLHDLENIGNGDLTFVTVELHRDADDPGPRQ
jgi:beta-alanine degradation protein BauB